MKLKCIHCGQEFSTKRSDAKFCSDACRKAYSRLANLMVNGKIIRGQHEYDVPPTNLGIEKVPCEHCGEVFSRWIESKLARLVRNEVEGSIHWDSRAFDRVRFDELKAIRMEEVKYCSEECQKEVVEGEYLNKPLLIGDLRTAEGDELRLEKGILRVRRRENVKKEVENTQNPKNEVKNNTPRRRGQ